MVYKAMLSAIAVLSSTTAMAQVAPPLAAAPSGDQPVAQQAGGLEDIVVTARRRSESSQNIPVAVTAFSAEQIDRQNLSSLEKVGAYTPQLTIARRSEEHTSELQSLMRISYAVFCLKKKKKQNKKTQI